MSETNQLQAEINKQADLQYNMDVAFIQCCK